MSWAWITLTIMARFADLAAGTYTIEATSAEAGVAVTGPFTLTITAGDGGSG